jgi:hypothetical protein
MPSISQSSTNTPIPDPSSGSSIISRPPGFALVVSCNLCSAAMRSSASGRALGGSSVTCSHPMGGEPGGEMRKFLSIAGGRRWVPPGGVTGVGSARKTRRTKAGLKAYESEHRVVCWWVVDIRFWSRIDLQTVAIRLGFVSTVLGFIDDDDTSKSF